MPLIRQRLQQGLLLAVAATAAQPLGAQTPAQPTVGKLLADGWGTRRFRPGAICCTAP